MNPVNSVLSPAVSMTPRVGEIASADQQRVEAVAQEFEGVFVSMLLKEMRNSLENGGFFGEENSDTYGGLFDLFIGKHLAQSKPLGIGDVLLQQYAKNSPSESETAAPENRQASVSA